MGLARAGGRALAAGERRLPTLEHGLGCVVLKLPVETPEQLNVAEHEAPARKLSGATGFVANTPDPSFHHLGLLFVTGPASIVI